MLTVVIAAHDEETCIRQKVENCLALDYPADKLEVLVGCDGCSDRTAEHARSTGDARVTVFEAPRSGKAAVLSRLVPSRRATSCSHRREHLIDKGAAKALVRHFRDASVGAVVGASASTTA